MHFNGRQIITSGRQSRAIAIGLLILGTMLLPAPSWATSIGTLSTGDYTFSNFQGPGSGMAAGAGTNINGIANGGASVGFSIDDAGNVTNFIRNANGTFATLSLGGTGIAANAINMAGEVVGVQNGQAFVLPNGATAMPLATPGTSSVAFGINDKGNVVGQYTTGSLTPGFFLGTNDTFVRIDAPAGPDSVNAQGVNNNGRVVDFYVGTDGQDHGFQANANMATNGKITGVAISDPKIPTQPGEPGATFVFSQILGINDMGVAAGYYGDSTTSQHGFLYNLNTGAYTFLDDPAEAFSNGVEVTQITGINNQGEITGFYSDANGVFHGFVATPTPEPTSLALAGFGMVAFVSVYRRAAARRA